MSDIQLKKKKKLSNMKEKKKGKMQPKMRIKKKSAHQLNNKD